jgi:hypothetical protein
MSALKFITKVSGLNKLVSAITASTGASDGNKILATNTSGKLDASFLPPGVELSVETMIASEALAAGDFVNIWDNAGTREARLADGSEDKPAHGYVIAGFALGASASIYTKGTNNQLTGLTPGVRYFLSDTTPGEATATPPSETSGHIFQVLGPAINATTIQFEYDDPVYVV